MKKKIKFQFGNKIYAVDIEQVGNELIIENEGAIYHVNLIPENIEEKKAKVSTSANLNVSLTPTEAQIQKKVDDEGLLLSPMTGIVKDIVIQKGDKVEKGQIVMIIEAMKMYVDIHAHKTGIVEDIYVKKGANVSLNQPLIVLK